MAIGKDTQPTLDEIKAEAIDRVEDFRSTLMDFAKRIQGMVEEFDPDSWEFKTSEVTRDELDDFHRAVQDEMDTLDTDYEDLRSVVFDLESDLTTWADIQEEELDNKDEAEMEAADSNYRRDA